MVRPRGRRARSIDRADLDALDSIRSRRGAHAVAEIDRHARPADRHGPAGAAHREARPAATRAAARRANPPDPRDRRSPRSRRPRRATLDATAASSGPQPARTMRRPGSMPCDLIRMVAAARPITPGSVQPGNGTTRSCAPVAAISRGAVNASWPSVAGDIDAEAACDRPDAAAEAQRDRGMRQSGGAGRRPSRRPRRGCRRKAARPARDRPVRRRAAASSISSTDRPCRAAASAARQPAGPAPITIRSNAAVIAPRPAQRGRNLEPRHDRHHAGLAQLAADPHQALLADAHEAEGAARRARVGASPQTVDAGRHQRRGQHLARVRLDRLAVDANRHRRAALLAAYAHCRVFRHRLHVLPDLRFTSHG